MSLAYKKPSILESTSLTETLAIVIHEFCLKVLFRLDAVKHIVSL